MEAPLTSKQVHRYTRTAVDLSSVDELQQGQKCVVLHPLQRNLSLKQTAFINTSMIEFILECGINLELGALHNTQHYRKPPLS